MGWRQCWGRPVSGGRATCDDSNALHECVWRHDALQPPSKFMSMKTLFSKISQFPSSGQPVTVFILYIRTTGDSVHTIHQDNWWQCSYYTSGQLVTVFILYIRTTGDSVHTIHQDNRWQCSYYTSGQPVTVFILYIRTTGYSVHTIQGGKDSAIAHTRGAPMWGGGCYRAAAPLNRNFKHTNFVTGCYETFNVIHPATKISHWNQLVTGTSELWKIQQKTQQDALGETE